MATTEEHACAGYATYIPEHNENSSELDKTCNNRFNESAGLSLKNNDEEEQANKEKRMIRGWRVSLFIITLSRSFYDMLTLLSVVGVGLHLSHVYCLALRSRQHHCKCSDRLLQLPSDRAH